MEWTTAQVEQMAPDAESLAAARKLHRNRFWQRLGLSPEAVWGECLGSSVYQVVAEVSSGGYHCTCPSRKYPCKHVLGLLWILAIEPSVFAEAVQPEWVSSWLAKRKLAQAQKEAKAQQPSKTVNTQARVKNAEQRLQRVQAGLEQFDIWLCDQVRDGLATWETQGKKPWEEQARRLVDAQAPGLAARLRQLGEIPGTSPDWPERLLGELGRIYLAIRAFRRLSELNPGLAMDLRQWMGWIIKAEDLQQAAAKVDDNWMFLGQWVEEQDRLLIQRTWCLGHNSQKLALIIDFVVGNGSLPKTLLPGTVQRGTMFFYPGAAPQRAQFVASSENTRRITSRFPGYADIESWLRSVAHQLGANPWLSSFGAALHQVSLVRQENRWFLRDTQGSAVPVLQQEIWSLLALSGGRPFDVFGEWSNQELRLLGAFVQGRYRVTV